MTTQKTWSDHTHWSDASRHGVRLCWDDEQPEDDDFSVPVEDGEIPTCPDCLRIRAQERVGVEMRSDAATLRKLAQMLEYPRSGFASGALLSDLDDFLVEHVGEISRWSPTPGRDPLARD